MYRIIREPDAFKIEYEKEGSTGGQLRFESGKSLKIYLTAGEVGVKYVYLRWYEKTEETVRVFGDEWERFYGNGEWRGIVPERPMPWYMLIDKGETIEGIGVKVRPSAMCFWQLDRGGITLVLDVRCASEGVHLNGRELFAAEVVSACYQGCSAFNAAKRFCHVMTDGPVFPTEPVYGSNNWYYAYGNSSHGEIIKDSEFVSGLTKGIDNRPFMVIDDGWSPRLSCGPWDKGNERFPDMFRLVREMRETGVKPGVWFRPLYDESPFTEGHTLKGEARTLDPTDPAVLGYVTETVRRLKDWGFELIKHDYSSIDITGTWGGGQRSFMRKDRVFADNSKTTAEVVKNLYRAIYENAGDMLVLGCNCINHLCVGYAHINRVGDDTSGVNWGRTRKMGINALAFRLCQDDAFFKVDADCVGLTSRIPWEKNKQWLELLAKSSTPLFVSAKIDDCTEEIKDALRQAFYLSSMQTIESEPLDWMENTTPAVWRFDGETRIFDFDDTFGASM